MQGIATLIGMSLGQENHEKDFSYSVTLFEKQCLPKPKLLLYSSVIPLTAILLTLLVMALMSTKVSQLRLMVCEQFFPSAAEERVEYLHGKILRKRFKMRKEKNNCSLRSLITKVHVNILLENNYCKPKKRKKKSQISNYVVFLFFFISHISGFHYCFILKRIHKVSCEENLLHTDTLVMAVLVLVQTDRSTWMVHGSRGEKYQPYTLV